MSTNKYTFTAYIALIYLFCVSLILSHFVYNISINQHEKGKYPMSKAVLKKSETKFMARIPQRELVEAMSELSSGAYKLLMYYYSRNDGWIFNDTNIGKSIGTSTRQVKKFRKELTDNDYLLIQRGQVDVYFIGSLAVEKFRNSIQTEEEQEAMEPLVASLNGQF